MNSNNEKPTVGLALGGGATLGAAHIGVLKAIEEMSIDVHCISGTSIGAYVSALYAFGTSPADIEEEIRGLNWLDISGFSLERIKFGLFTNDKLGKSLEKMLGSAQISDSELPLAIVATDISSGKKVELTECAVSQAVMASTAVPGIFSPVEIDGQMLVDGGLVENVPVTPLRELGADLIIGVDLSARRSYRKPDDLIDVLMNSIDIAIDNATRLQTSKADIVISPELSAYSRTDTAQISELVDEGFRAARTTINDSDLRPD
jgi:NTE family protein